LQAGFIKKLKIFYNMNKYEIYYNKKKNEENLATLEITPVAICILPAYYWYYE